MRKLNIPFKPEDSHEKLVEILLDRDVKPNEIIDFVAVNVKTPDGDKQVVVPDQKDRKERSDLEITRRAEEFERRIEAATEKARIEEEAKLRKAHDSEVSDLRKQIKDLTEMVKTLAQDRPKEKETDPAKMKYMAFKKWCKDRGHDLQKGEDKAELIKRLSDGENAT